MELKYPWVLYIGIPLLLFLIIFKIKKEKKYKTGTKVANTQYAEKIPYFQKVMAKYKLLTGAIKIICILSILTSLFLISRPYKVETSQESVHSRDVFLCIDASTSVNEVTQELALEFKDLVDELDGERVGVTIFNTTTVVLCPLTDDYEYVKQVLDNISKAIESQENLSYDSDDYSFYWKNYMFEGTITGNAERGSSLIGDGLASCIYSFPDLETDQNRTRIVIFATDNDDRAEPGEEIVSLKEAMQIAQDNKIHVFAIAPQIAGKYGEDLRKKVESINGTYFEYGKSDNMSKIVKEINTTSKSLIKTRTEIREIGQPEIAFIVLVVLVSILFFINKKVKI